MKIELKGIAKTVPAICILLGFIAIFLFRSGLGWIFVISGIILQVLFLLSRGDRRY